MGNKFKGNVPKGGFNRAEFWGWVLYERPLQNPQAWRSFKLVAEKDRKTRKGNYWLGWNGERLARNHDTGVLARKHPDLHAALLGWLQANCPSVSVKGAPLRVVDEITLTGPNGSFQILANGDVLKAN